MASTIPLTLETIQAARGRIRGFVHRTPVLTCSYLDQLSGFKLFFKCENLQKTGSFKVRDRRPWISMQRYYDTISRDNAKLLLLLW